MMYSPCAPYLTVGEALDLGCVCKDLDLDGYDEEEDPQTDPIVLLYEKALGWASDRLYMATGFMFSGVCETKIRPCRRPTGWAFDAPFFADLYGSPLWDCSLCTCWRDDCSCPDRDRLRLPWAPIVAVSEVKIDGAVVPPTDYLLRPGTDLLVRVDGDRWPVCADQDLEDTEVGTMSVTFTHGLTLPDSAVPLLAGYACELSKRCLGGKCDLPEGVKVLSRPGVEYDEVVVDAMTYRGEQLTGYAPLDDWIMLLRGGHTSTQPRVYIPGRTRPVGLVEPVEPVPVP